MRFDAGKQRSIPARHTDFRGESTFGCSRLRKFAIKIPQQNLALAALKSFRRLRLRRSAIGKAIQHLRKEQRILLHRDRLSDFSCIVVLLCVFLFWCRETPFRRTLLFSMTFEMPLKSLLSKQVSIIALCCAASFGLPAANAQRPSAQRPASKQEPQAPPAVKTLEPLFRQIRDARTSRVTIELSSETIIDGAVVSRQPSTYQIASAAPSSYTVYLKDAQQGTRIFCNGRKTTIALSPTAYTNLDQSTSMQESVLQLPLPMGPYPEVILALSLAGVDPTITLTTGMKSILLKDREKFRGETPAIHFTGVQDDDVQWDLWMTQDKQPKPLRLLVDLSKMLRANGDLEMPAGYRYLLRFDFKTWRLNNRTDPTLFEYTPTKGAKEFESVESYYASLREAATAAGGDKESTEK